MNSPIEIPGGDSTFQVWLCRWPEWCTKYDLRAIHIIVRDTGVAFVYGDELETKVKTHREQGDDYKFHYSVQYEAIFEAIE